MIPWIQEVLDTFPEADISYHKHRLHIAKKNQDEFLINRHQAKILDIQLHWAKRFANAIVENWPKKLHINHIDRVVYNLRKQYRIPKHLTSYRFWKFVAKLMKARTRGFDINQVCKDCHSTNHKHYGYVDQDIVSTLRPSLVQEADIDTYRMSDRFVENPEHTEDYLLLVEQQEQAEKDKRAEKARLRSLRNCPPKSKTKTGIVNRDGCGAESPLVMGVCPESTLVMDVHSESVQNCDGWASESALDDGCGAESPRTIEQLYAEHELDNIINGTQIENPYAEQMAELEASKEIETNHENARCEELPRITKSAHSDENPTYVDYYPELRNKQFYGPEIGSIEKLEERDIFCHSCKKQEANNMNNFYVNYFFSRKEVNLNKLEECQHVNNGGVLRKIRRLLAKRGGIISATMSRSNKNVDWILYSRFMGAESVSPNLFRVVDPYTGESLDGLTWKQRFGYEDAPKCSDEGSRFCA